MASPNRLLQMVPFGRYLSECAGLDFLIGSSKTEWGYRETKWSLPRAEQESIETFKNVTDGPGKRRHDGRMFVPSLNTTAAGRQSRKQSNAHENLPQFEARLSTLRSRSSSMLPRPRIYDTLKQKALVHKRDILPTNNTAKFATADLIHLRRPDGSEWDGLHYMKSQTEKKKLWRPLQSSKRTQLFPGDISFTSHTRV